MPRRSHGFSLIEMLVAFSIMALSMAVLYRSAASSVQGVSAVVQQERAAMAAESLLASRDAVPAAGWNEDGALDGLRWQVRSTPYASGIQGPATAALQQVDIVVAWGDGAQAKRLAVSTLRPQLPSP